MALYRASLTQSTIETSAGPLTLIDELQPLTNILPGSCLPTFYICATNKEGVLANDESGRIIHLSIRVRPSSSTDPSSTATAATHTNTVEDEPAHASFCTCIESLNKSSLVLHHVTVSPDTTTTTEASSSSPPSSSRRRKNAASGSSGTGNKLVQRSPRAAGSKKKGEDSAREALDGGFVCTGACQVQNTDGTSSSSVAAAPFRVELKHGWTAVSGLRLSAACTPASCAELVITDGTIDADTADTNHQDITNISHKKSSSHQSVSLTNHPLVFQPLHTITLGVQIGGQAVKKVKKPVSHTKESKESANTKDSITKKSVSATPTSPAPIKQPSEKRQSINANANQS